MDNKDQVLEALCIGTAIAWFLLSTNHVKKAIELFKECLLLLNNKALEKEKEFVSLTWEVVYFALIIGYRLINNHTSALECGRRLLASLRRNGRTDMEGTVIFELAGVYQQQCKYKEAKELYTKALTIAIATGERQGEATCYGNLGTVCRHLGEYVKAKGYHEKALAIRKEISDRRGEGAAYGNLGTVFQSLGEYHKAKAYLEKALAITKEIGDRKEETACYINLGIALWCLGEYAKAKEHLEKALAMTKEIGDRKGEATCYGSLGNVVRSLGDYAKAKEYLEKALAITKEIGDKKEEATCYGNLGTVLQSLCEYTKAKEYHARALAIRKEIGDINGEAADYGNLGNIFHSLGQYAEAKESFEKALAIAKEIGNRKGQVAHSVSLGTVLQSLGEDAKAKEYLEEGLVITKESGDRGKEALCYGNLGTVFRRLGDLAKAKKCHEKALAINKTIGHREGEAVAYGNLGSIFISSGEYDKAIEYLKRALTIVKEIGDSERVATCYGHLGVLFRSLGEYSKAKEYLEKALEFHREAGHIRSELKIHANLSLVMVLEGNIHEAKSHLFASIRGFEDMRSLLRENDYFKISFFDEHVDIYQFLSYLFCATQNHSDALYAAELGRARALADLMSAQYSVKKQMSFNPQTWVGIERIMEKERNCTCLYISYWAQFIFLWILKAGKPVLFRKIVVSDWKGSAQNVVEVFGSNTFRKFPILPQTYCEDRSWFPSKISNASQPTQKSTSRDDSMTALQKPEEDTEAILALYYKMIIDPVADLLKEPEILFIPDRVFYNVALAALKDESGNNLSETFRIRIVPSLTTLTLIQDSPADYHSQTGALIVGDPDVGEVQYKGDICNPEKLPSAKKEAEMIGRLLKVQPLLGKQATKQAVLESITSMSLIHFAAHGNAERGEIVLAPPRPTNGIPQEEDYLLTMADISQVRLRAKLVVLSCCHSARGQIRAEGVVGIARAFLGSGARSMLVALWAIDDIATEQFMSRFYEHLVRGESASESLHQAMKWMRTNGFSDVGQWAPFILIGDNVTFDFGK